MSHPSRQNLPINCEATRRRRGFTFVEVMFAVILLGIGFIMIAGVFPVSIQQSAFTIDENTGTTVARGALDQIQEAINSGMTMPATTNSTGTAPAFWPFLMGTSTPAKGMVQLSYLGSASFFYPGLSNYGARWSNSINTMDPRMGWMAFYNRQKQPNGLPYPYAQIIAIALKNPNFQFYAQQPLLPTDFFPPNPTVASAPTPFNAQLSLDTTGNPTIVFVDTPVPENLAPGAFAIVEEAPLIGGELVPAPGRIYRLGAQTNTGTYQIQPGTDPQFPEWPNSTHTVPIKVYVVGRAATPGINYTANPTDFSGHFTGANQDIAVVSGIVRINQ